MNFTLIRMGEIYEYRNYYCIIEANNTFNFDQEKEQKLISKWAHLFLKTY